jgi:hypothetical protein
MEWIETNGVVLRYELSGAGQTPLLLIHELGMKRKQLGYGW